MNEKVISESIMIDCAQEDVWDYITTPETWTSWYVWDDLKEVTPDWREGGVLHFSSGDKATILEYTPPARLRLSDNVYIRLTKMGSDATRVEYGWVAKGLQYEDPLFWADLQRSYSEDMANILERLKDRIEN